MTTDGFLSELDEIIARNRAENLLYTAVGEGRVSIEVLKRLCKEFYVLGAWYTAEFPVMIANAPDTDALWLESSEHYLHWFRLYAGEVGLLDDPSHVGLKIEWAEQLGVTEVELLGYEPMPESIGSTFTTLYFMRRSYEEGLAAFAYAGERAAGRTNYARTLYEGMRDHYGIEVRNFYAHAYDESEPAGDPAATLLRDVAVTPASQRRVRRAVTLVSRARRARVEAMNRWLDEPGALREPAN
ncbi:MAG TPA: hypothetical protein VGB83_12085 [Actinomycetota bacterium]